MRAYVVFVNDGGYCEPNSAVLVFGWNRINAKIVAHSESCMSNYHYTELRVRWLKNNTDYWFSLGDKKKLKKGIPHVIEDVPSCSICGTWLNPDGTCPLCKECREAI